LLAFLAHDSPPCGDDESELRHLSKFRGPPQSAIRRRVNQLTEERDGVTPKGKALTPEQRRIQELEARCKRVEQEKDILKKVTALLMSDDMNRTR